MSLKKNLLFVIVILLAILISFHEISYADSDFKSKTYIVFRYDDFSPDNPKDREINDSLNKLWQAEKGIDHLFKKYQMKYVIGIIPLKLSNNLKNSKSSKNYISLSKDIEKCNFLKMSVSDGRIEIAQHGLSHINHSEHNYRAGEFLNRSYNNQYEDISQGKKILMSALNLDNLDVFIPPYNGWDKNTAEALIKENFRILSADRYSYTNTELRIIPFTAQLWEIEELLLNNKNNNVFLSNIIIVLYHPPQLIKTNGAESRYFGLERFDKLLKSISLRENYKVVTFNELIEYENIANNNRYQKSYILNSLKDIWDRIIPLKILKNDSDIIFNGETYYINKIIYWSAVLVFFIIILCYVSIKLIKRIIFFSELKYLKMLLFFNFIILTISTYYIVDITLRNYHISIIRLIPFIISISCFFYQLKNFIIRTTVKK